MRAIQASGHYSGDVYHYGEFERPGGFKNWLDFDGRTPETREEQIREGVTHYIDTMALNIYYEALNENAARNVLPEWERELMTPADPVSEVVNTFEGTMSERNTARLRELVEGKLRAEREAESQRAAYERQAEQYRTQLARALAPLSDASDERLQPIWEQAHSAADDAGYCPEFDRMMEAIGAPTRPRLYRVIVEATVNAYVFVTAQTEDDARELAESRFDEVLGEVGGIETEGEYNTHSDGSVTQFDYNSVSAESSELYG
jgi:hypothetical protein